MPHPDRAFRLLSLVISLFIPTFCAAQTGSRIVFFRMDAAVGAKSTPIGEYRAYTDELLKDGSPIASMRSTSVFVYNTPSAKGSYSLAPKVSGPDHSNVLEMTGQADSIAFVKISLGNTTPISAHLEGLSLDEFRRCYAHAKWLRSKLEESGFASVDELIKGFTPVTPPSVKDASAPFPAKRKRSLTDTLFFGRFGQLTERPYASSFSVTSADTGGLFLIRDYYLPDGELEAVFHHSTLDSESKEGAYARYFRSGRLSTKGVYRNNRQEGVWESYYDTASGPVWSTETYRQGKPDGMLTSYYLNGKLKREELHRHFIDTIYVKGDNGPQRVIREKDSIVSGHRYDEAHGEIPFTPFTVMPVPSFNLQAFLNANLHYPDNARERGIEGRVIIYFIVDKTGRITEAAIGRSAAPDLDAEALRVVRLMDRWKPGMRDDRPEDVFFTLPVTFMLD